MTAAVAPARPTFRDRWRRIGLGKRLVTVVVAGVVIAYGIQIATESVLGGGNPGGPTSSSYATGSDGYAAFADLLADRGHPVVRLRKPVAKVELDPSSTVVVADPDLLEPSDAEALVEFVGQGGRLVVAGRNATPLLAPFAGRDVSWSSDGMQTAAPLVPTPESSVSVIAASGRGSFDGLGSLLPVMGSDGRTVVATGSAPTGSGTVVGLADAQVLANDHLGERDNAAFGLDLAGPAGRPVTFVESVHGYGTATGLAALPSSWKWAAAGLLIAALCAMWAAGQRFGPPERSSRAFPPPRRAYVDALAADLTRADPDPAHARAMLARTVAEAPAGAAVAPAPTPPVPAPSPRGAPR